MVKNWAELKQQKLSLETLVRVQVQVEHAIIALNHKALRKQQDKSQSEGKT